MSSTANSHIELDFTNQRQSYEQGELLETTLPDTPMPLLQTWLEQAIASEPHEAYALALATCGRDQQPSVRTVLMRELVALDSGQIGLTFYTNYDSAKAADLAANPRAEALFFWASQQQQVRISGQVAKVSRAQTADYFAKRPHDSQLAAWVSTPQSGVVDSRDTMQKRYDALAEQYRDQAVPVPDFWGGYQLTAESIEFWQGRANRMHDRIVYVWQDASWTRERLLP